MILTYLILLVGGLVVSALKAPLPPKPTLPQDAPTVQAGIAATFTEQFFNEFLVQSVWRLESVFHDKSIVDNQKQFKVGSTNVFIDLKNQRVQDLYLYQEISSARILRSKKAIHLDLREIKFNYTTDYEIYTEPEWIKDQGRAVINITLVNISFLLVPVNNNGKLELNFEDVKVALNDDYILFNGTSDWSKAMTIITRSLKLFFKYEIGNMIAR